jgi:hypothetical protein
MIPDVDDSVMATLSPKMEIKANGTSKQQILYTHGSHWF